MNNFCAECGSISLSKERTPLKKNKKEFKVSGKMSLLSKKFWSKSKEVRMQIAVPGQCAVRTTQRSLAIGKVSSRNAGKKESFVNGTLKGFRRLMTREDIGQLSIAQQILRKSTDFLETDHRASRRNGRSHFFVRLHAFLDDHLWWVSTGHGDGNNIKKKHCNWWCAACGGQYEWRAPKRILVAKVCKTHAAPLGLCDNLVNALKLLANQQKDGRPNSKHHYRTARKKQEASWMD